MPTKTSNQTQTGAGQPGLKKQIAQAAKWAFRAKESLLKSASSNNYHTARAFYRRKLERTARNRGGPPLLVYNMGKVGSKTVIRSLQELMRNGAGSLDMPIYHVHFLTQSLIDEYLEKRKPFVGTEKQGRLEHIWLYEYLREQLDLLLANKQKPLAPWKVVTLTRETVGRNVSNFFELVEVKRLKGSGATDTQESQLYHVRSDPDFYDFEIQVDTENLSPLLDVFLQYPDHNEPLKFFHEEIKGVLGIDIYEKPFLTSEGPDGQPATPAAGYAIYKTNLIELLLIRVEDLNRCANQAFSEFLGIPELPLINENVGSAKDYASLYKTFKDSVLLPEPYIDQMYATPYMRHFYSDSEIAAFRARWVK